MEYNYCNKLKENVKKFPKTTGVYLMKNAAGKIIYVGKATSLHDRVANYFTHPHDSRIEKMVSEIDDIKYKATPTVIEALISEANLIKKYQPKYNVKEKDNKSFLYATFANEKFPRLMLLRGREIKKYKVSNIKHKVFGPFTSASALRAALDILRKIFPYRDCAIFPKRPCLQYHLKRCGAPCVGLIPRKDYKKNLRNLILFFGGKKEKVIKNLKKEMIAASRRENFELAAKLRNQIFSLNHIQDVAILTIDSKQLTVNDEKGNINIFDRIEGYDISNISGTSATGSMAVFTDGWPNKNEYRKFRIKTVHGANDVAMIKEVISRRLQHQNLKSKILNLKSNHWPLPNLILVDGGWGQINAVREILVKRKIKIPVLGIAKGFDRKQDRLLYNSENLELGRVAEQNKDLLLRVRDEAHRFAIGYHKILRRKKLLDQTTS